MNVMTILGSPRRAGNTNQVLRWVEEDLAASGHTVDRADIGDYRVEGCDDCRECKDKADGRCARGDGANALFARMRAADAIVFAAPLYCWGFPAQLKALVDRMHCMVQGFTGAPNHASMLAGKTIALLATAGGGYEKNMDLLVLGFENLVEFQQGRAIEPLLLHFCTEPGALGGEAREKARAFAGRITAA